MTAPRPSRGATFAPQNRAHPVLTGPSQQAKLLNGFNRSPGYLDKTDSRNAAVNKACEA